LSQIGLISAKKYFKVQTGLYLNEYDLLPFY